MQMITIMKIGKREDHLTRTAFGAPTRRIVLAGMGAVAGASLFAPAVLAQDQLTQLTIPISSYSFATAPLRAAIELGSFERNGLAAETLVMDSGSAIMTALISGSADVILGGPGEVVAAQGRGQEIVLLTNVYWGLAATLVLAKDVAEASGISPTAPVEERLKALDGLSIGAPSATSAYTVAYRGAAEGVGASPEFVYMAQPAMIAALETGAIKGFIAGAPNWGVSVARDQAVVWINGPAGELPQENIPASVTGFNTTRAYAEANPQLMRQIIDSYKDFSEILVNSPERVREVLGKLYPDVEPATLDILFAAEGPAWQFRDVTVEDMAREIAFVKAAGADIPNIDSLDPATMFFVPPEG